MSDVCSSDLSAWASAGMPPAALIASSRPGLLSILLVLVVRPLDMKANMHQPKMVSTAPRHDRQRGGSASAFWPWACPRELFARQRDAVTPRLPLSFGRASRRDRVCET